MSAALYQPHCFCLALACHHTETLPPATAAVKRSDTLDIHILAGVYLLNLSTSCSCTVYTYCRPTFNRVYLATETIREPLSDNGTALH